MTNLREKLEARKQEQINAALKACERHGYPQSDEPLCLLVDDCISPYNDALVEAVEALNAMVKLLDGVGMEASKFALQTEIKSIYKKLGVSE